MTQATLLRTLGHQDANEALILYNELTVGPEQKDPAVFQAVIDHPGTQVFGAFSESALAAIVTLHLLPNVLWDARPYALIENVVTGRHFRRRGFGRQIMEHAIAAAWASGAYKIMLMTGQKRGAVGFYEALGFSSEDKFAMVMRKD
ncbi:MAG: GNAT family N-acetyltransferase [Sulfitobacter sp.]